MEKLRSMSEYVLDIVQTPNVNEAICFEQTQARLDKIYQYALFLKQPIKLGMFIYCDKDDNILKHMNDIYPFATNEEIIEWEEGLKPILFNGWKLNEGESFKNKEVITITNRSIQLTFFKKTGMVIYENLVIKSSFIVKTIGDIAHSNLELQNEIK